MGRKKGKYFGFPFLQWPVLKKSMGEMLQIPMRFKDPDGQTGPKQVAGSRRARTGGYLKYKAKRFIKQKCTYVAQL